MKYTKEMLIKVQCLLGKNDMKTLSNTRGEKKNYPKRVRDKKGV